MTTWIGTWRLLPDLCHSDAGAVPETATYTIARDGERITMRIDWGDGNGAMNAVFFSAMPDGTPVALESDDVDTYALTSVTDRVLTSTALRNGEEVGYAVRRVSRDGRRMTVLQITDFGDEGIHHMLQIFERTDG